MKQRRVLFPINSERWRFISIWLAVVRLAERYFNVLHSRACFDTSEEKQVNCASENSSSART